MTTIQQIHYNLKGMRLVGKQLKCIHTFIDDNSCYKCGLKVNF